MIQRIQTIYLLLVSGLMLAMLFLSAANEVIFDWILMGIAGLTGIISAVTIFLYKNRKLQIKLCNVILLLLILSCAVIVYNWFPAIQSMDVQNIKYPALFPVIAIILDLLAIHSIKKDEKLVRSADRLR